MNNSRGAKKKKKAQHNKKSKKEGTKNIVVQGNVAWISQQNKKNVARITTF